MKSILFVLFGAFCATCRGSMVKASSDEWSYKDQDAWRDVSGWNCAGMRQSPININTNSLVMNHDLADLKLWNFDQDFNGTFTNNGHTVKFTPADGSPAALFQNHLGTYELQQFHFHWGPNDQVGSEHNINGSPTSGELHFVTKKTTGAPATGDAYAVLGVLLSSHNSLPMTQSLRELYNNIPSGVNAANNVYKIKFTDFIPANMDYYYYEGSLTTPPCSEVVQWFVMRIKTFVPFEFLVKLRQIQSSSGGNLDMNYRYTQPLDGRQVMKETSCSGIPYTTGQL